MKKIQAKKKRDRAEADAEAALAESAPDNGQPIRNMLDDDDDVPILFN